MFYETGDPLLKAFVISGFIPPYLYQPYPYARAMIELQYGKRRHGEGTNPE